MKILVLATSLIFFYGCTNVPDEEIQMFSESRGHLIGEIKGNVSKFDWEKYTQPPYTERIVFEKISLRAFDPKLMCDSVYYVSLYALYQGIHADWGFQFFINEKDLGTMKTDNTLHYMDLYTQQGPDYNCFCDKFPKIRGVRSNGDSNFGDYLPVTSSNNFLRLEYLAPDTIIGSFYISFEFSRPDSWLVNYPDIDKNLTFDCKKFVAVRDTLF